MFVIGWFLVSSNKLNYKLQFGGGCSIPLIEMILGDNCNNLYFNLIGYKAALMILRYVNTKWYVDEQKIVQEEGNYKNYDIQLVNIGNMLEHQTK